MMRLTFWVVSALAFAAALAAVNDDDDDGEVRGGGGRDADGDENENGRDATAGLAVGARLAVARVAAMAVLLSACSMVDEGVGWVAGDCDECSRCPGCEGDARRLSNNQSQYWRAKEVLNSPRSFDSFPQPGVDIQPFGGSPDLRISLLQYPPLVSDLVSQPQFLLSPRQACFHRSPRRCRCCRRHPGVEKMLMAMSC